MCQTFDEGVNFKGELKKGTSEQLLYTALDTSAAGAARPDVNPYTNTSDHSLRCAWYFFPCLLAPFDCKIYFSVFHVFL